MRQDHVKGRKYRNYLRSAAGTIAGLLMPFTAQAFDFQLHGFADLVGSKSTTDHEVSSVVGNNDQRLTLDHESRIGFNVNADLGEDFGFVAQMLARGDESGGYHLTADWLFVTYQPIEAVTIRAGRQINPFLFYAEQVDVGFTYPWVRLPMEVYSVNPVKSFNGLGIIGKWFLSDDVRIEGEIFGGGGEFSLRVGENLISGELNNFKGAEVQIIGDRFRGRLSASLSHPRLDVQRPVTLSTVAGGTVTGTFQGDLPLTNVQVYSAGLSADYGKFTVTGEGTRFLADGGFADSATGAYGSLIYHSSPRLSPYVIYGRQWNQIGSAYAFPDATVSTTRKDHDWSFTGGLNYKLTPSARLKAEVMHSKNIFQDPIVNYSANTYSASIDVIF